MPNCNLSNFDSRILTFKFVFVFNSNCAEKQLSFVTVTKMKLLIDDVNEN